jgi:hypothetical protein
VSVVGRSFHRPKEGKQIPFDFAQGRLLRDKAALRNDEVWVRIQAEPLPTIELG